MIEHILQQFVCERFKNDASYREGHLRVLNALPGRRVLGLHTPEMKLVAKRLSSNGGEVMLPDGRKLHCCNGAEVIRYFEQISSASLCYEETMVWGFLINNEKCDAVSRLAMLSRFVPVFDNWAVCDAFCANAKWMAGLDKRLLWNYLQPWFASKREFEVRFAVVVSMCYLLCDGWVDTVFVRLAALDFETIESEYRAIKGKNKIAQAGCVLGKSPYYVRMGVAWLLATALAKFPVVTRSFVRESKLPDDVVRLYIRKARESFRTRMVDAL